MDREFYGYDRKDSTETEGAWSARYTSPFVPCLPGLLARLIITLAVDQNKLTHVEAGSNVSHHPVQELKLEPEACKKEIAREWTGILENVERPEG